MTDKVKRIRSNTIYDVYGVLKSFIWDNPVEIDNGVYLGNIGHSFFSRTLETFNIKAIVNVTGDFPNFYDPDVNYFNIRIPDLNEATIIGDLEKCYEFIIDNLSKANVLIHCLFGRSRSVAVCVFYLMKKYGLTFQEAYQKIETQKTIINLNCTFAQEIQEYFNQSGKSDISELSDTIQVDFTDQIRQQEQQQEQEQEQEQEQGKSVIDIKVGNDDIQWQDKFVERDLTNKVCVLENVGLTPPI